MGEREGGRGLAEAEAELLRNLDPGQSPSQAECPGSLMLAEGTMLAIMHLSHSTVTQTHPQATYAMRISIRKQSFPNSATFFLGL